MHHKMADYTNPVSERPSHIEDILVPLHPGSWFTWSDTKNKIYANLVIRDVVNGESVSYSKPSESSLNSDLAAAQADWDAKAYARKRIMEYPDAHTFMEAYTEKEIGGDSTKWDAYVIAYNKVRTDNPK
jgi:hypothetical protein